MRLLIVCLLIVTPVLSYASGFTVKADRGVTPLQEFAPNASRSVAVTSTKSQVFSQISSAKWSFTPVADCKGRVMPTSVKGAYPQFTMKANTEYRRAVHPNSTFLNISGCTGDYQAQ